MNKRIIFISLGIGALIFSINYFQKSKDRLLEREVPIGKKRNYKKLVDLDKRKVKKSLNNSIQKKYFSKKNKVKINEKKYLVSTEIRATKKESYQDDLGDKISERGQLVFYKKKTNEVDDPFLFTSLDLPVLIDENTSIVYVVTGNIGVKVGQNVNIDTFAKKNNFIINYRAEHLSFYMLQEQQSKSLMSSLEILKENSSIKKIELELIGIPNTLR